ncbi:MAG TPA: YggT family protein [Gammaproteobacteria bacterium]|nr:YggT family protein [Gammaproteobacteria bacterium]
MSSTLNAALQFLLKTIFDLYLTILVIRIILVYVRANYFDPITQFIVKLTDFLVKPLRYLVPNFRRFEWSSILLVLVLELIKFTLLSMITFGVFNIVGLLLLTVGDTLNLIIQVFFYAILIQAILTWVQPGSLLNHLLYQFTAPIMQPFQRIIPHIGGVDISPIPALITLQLLNIILVNPMLTAGFGTVLG